MTFRPRIASRYRQAVAAVATFAAAGLAMAVLPGPASADKRPHLQALPASKVLTAAERAREGATARERRSRVDRGIELLSSHPNRLLKHKRRAARELAPAEYTDSAPGGRGPRAAVFGGLNELGLVAGTRTPPDSTGAIGESQYVEMVNSEIAAYDRTDLGLDEAMSLGEFIGFPGDNVFDPQVQWDPVADRWLFVADDLEPVGGGNFDNFLAFGWSTNENATPLGRVGDGGNWCVFFIGPTNPEFEDYPKLGHSDDFIVIGTNVFDDDDDFLGSRIWAIPKPAAGDNSCTEPPSFETDLPLTTPDGEIAFTPVPANTFEGSTSGYVVAADDPFDVASPNEIAMWHVESEPDPPNDPVLAPDGDVPVAAFSVPANVPQPGTGAVLDSLDARLTQAVARTNPATGALSVWTQHTVSGPGGRSVVRWYELRTDTLTARQQGTISDPAQFVFNGAISPSSNGTSAVIDYNRGGSSLNAQIQARSRLGGTALGAMGNPATVGTSAAADQDFSCFDQGGPCRWGDYAGATPDPATATLVWGSNQVNGPPSGDNPAWRTRNFALAPTGTGPDTTITSGPASGATVDASTTSFGFTSDDPGASFQCRVDGGAFAACTSPRTVGPLPNGVRTFEARAIGGGGLVDPTPASRAFTLDDPGPETEITKRPPNKVKSKGKRAKAKFKFEVVELAAAAAGSPPDDGITFECKLDGKGFKSCTSPRRVKVKAKRKFKRHRFRVRATNELGTTGPTAKDTWKVKRKPKG